MIRQLFLIIIFLSMAASTAFGQQQQNGSSFFELDDLSQRNRETDTPYLRFIDEGSLSMGLYELPAGAVDRQSPHKRDEVYYVTKGNASLSVADDTLSVGPGSIVYVKAQIPHRFFDITDDLQVLVIFSNTEPGAGDPDWRRYDIETLKEQRNPGKNSWNPFLDVSSMQFGIYMLPRAVGGDKPLVHDTDEINIVVNGRSTFIAGDEKKPVKPGSIFFVKQDVDHYFQDIRDEHIDILILFHKK